jgi:transposase
MFNEAFHSINLDYYKRLDSLNCIIGQITDCQSDITTMAPHGSEISCKIRKRIVTLHKKGHSYQKISNALEISRNTVAKVIQRYKKNGEVLNMKQLGRPRKLTPKDERHLGLTLENNRKASTVELAKALESQTGVNVSTDTVRRSVH